MTPTCRREVSSGGWFVGSAGGSRGVEDYTEKVLSAIPDDFDEVLLDVPAGTGVLTFEKYARLKRVTIVAVDYSLGMLHEGKKRLELHNIGNVNFIRGDVGNLPVKDSSIDLCVSMNGLHAFPQKELAFDEIYRVLKPEGKFVGCFYITGKRELTDFLVGAALSRSGSFTRPFYDELGALSLLETGFRLNSKGNNGSIFHFDAHRSFRRRRVAGAKSSESGVVVQRKAFSLK